MTINGDWKGRTVFVLAVAVSIGFVIAIIAIALSPMPFHGDTGRALSAGFGAFIGIIVGYVFGARVGSRLHRKIEGDESRD